MTGMDRRARDEPRPWQQRLERLLPLLLIVLVALCFRQVTDAETVSLDDPHYVGSDSVHDDQAVQQTARIKHGLSAENIAWAFTDLDQAGLYIPLTWLSLLLDVTLFGHKAAGFHFTNLVLHAANTVLVYGLLRRATGDPWRAALVAALWAVHPLRVESVAWITERKDVLSVFLALLALLAYLRAAATGKLRHHALVAALLALGLLAKPMLVTLPALLLLLDFWPLHRPLSRRLLLEKLPLFTLSVAAAVLTFVAQGRTGATFQLAQRGLPVRLATALFGYGQYLFHTAWPFGLAPFYEFKDAWPAWQLTLSALALAAITYATIRCLRHANRAPLAGWLWFLLALVPVSGLFQAGLQGWADRFSYLPAIGLTLAIVWSIPESLSAKTRAGLTVAALALTLLLAALSVRQLPYWHDSEALWARITAIEGDRPRFEQLRGRYLYQKAEFEQALLHYQAAARMAPANAEAQFGIGVCLAELGQIAPGYEKMELGIKLAPPSERAAYQRWFDQIKKLLAQTRPTLPATPAAPADTPPAEHP